MSADQNANQDLPAASSSAATAVKAKPVMKPGQLPPYNVVLLDDPDHTHEYVMEMLRSLFGYPPEEGYRLAQEVDTRKRAIVHTTHREKAELKRDQIHAFGTDVRVATCAGSMSATIEPAAG